MRLHTDKVTREDLTRAAETAGVTLAGATPRPAHMMGAAS